MPKSKSSDKKPKIYLGLDLGGTKMMMSAITPQLKVLNRVRKKTHANKGAKDGMRRMIKGIQTCLEEIGEHELLGIGVGCPGPIDRESGIIGYLPNLKWRRIPIVDILGKEFDCPVSLNNDVNMGAYGEVKMGAAQGFKNVIGIFPGTGIGGAIVLDGKLVSGVNGYAGEIGHVCVMPNGPLCGCGNFGCLEALAGRLAVARQAATAALRGEAPFLLKNSGTDVTKIKSSDLSEAIAGGDKVIETIVHRTARLIGYAAADICTLLNPDMIILGGGLVEAMSRIYIDEISAGIKERALSFSKRAVKVRKAKLGDDAVVLGAAITLMEELGEDVDAAVAACTKKKPKKGKKAG